jgi:hypothetical protein
LKGEGNLRWQVENGFEVDVTPVKKDRDGVDELGVPRYDNANNSTTSASYHTHSALK